MADLCLPARQCEGLSRQLEEERGKVGQLRRDMEAFKRKTKAEQERTARMVRESLDCLHYIPSPHLPSHAQLFFDSAITIIKHS